MKINPSEFPHQHFHKLLLGSIAPRPIAFVSTVDKNGTPNLSPYSFFNAFGVNPTTLIFSPSRRGRDNTTKHTFENIKEVPEVVINVVSYKMVQQASLSSTEYPKGVNEFVKAGFTQIPSETVKPPRVKESPVQYECMVRQVIETGDGPGAGNLIICEILLAHFDEDILDANQMVDPDKIDLVGRMGGDYYVRASGAAKFLVPKPLTTLGIGIDQLPERIRFSPHLSGNELGMLGNLESLPDSLAIEALRENHSIREKFRTNENLLFEEAKNLIKQGKTDEALKLLMAFAV